MNIWTFLSIVTGVVGLGTSSYLQTRFDALITYVRGVVTATYTQIYLFFNDQDSPWNAIIVPTLRRSITWSGIALAIAIPLMLIGTAIGFIPGQHWETIGQVIIVIAGIGGAIVVGIVLQAYSSISAVAGTWWPQIRHAIQQVIAPFAILGMIMVVAATAVVVTPEHFFGIFGLLGLLVALFAWLVSLQRGNAGGSSTFVVLVAMFIGLLAFEGYEQVMGYRLSRPGAQNLSNAQDNLDASEKNKEASEKNLQAKINNGAARVNDLQGVQEIFSELVEVVSSSDSVWMYDINGNTIVKVATGAILRAFSKTTSSSPRMIRVGVTYIHPQHGEINGYLNIDHVQEAPSGAMIGGAEAGVGAWVYVTVTANNPFTLKPDPKRTYLFLNVGPSRLHYQMGTGANWQDPNGRPFQWVAAGNTQPLNFWVAAGRAQLKYKIVS